MPPDELPTVAGPGSNRLAGAPECDPAAEFRAVAVAGQDRLRLAVHFADHEAAVLFARRSEAPLDVAEHADPARGRRGVGQREDRDLDRVLGRDGNGQLLAQALERVLEPRD